jgi:hypothetical protein
MVIAHVMDGVGGSLGGDGAQARAVVLLLGLDGEHKCVPWLSILDDVCLQSKRRLWGSLHKASRSVSGCWGWHVSAGQLLRASMTMGACSRGWPMTRWGKIDAAEDIDDLHRVSWVCNSMRWHSGEQCDNLGFASVDQQNPGLVGLIYRSRASYLVRDIEIGSCLDWIGIEFAFQMEFDWNQVLFDLGQSRTLVHLR